MPRIDDGGPAFPRPASEDTTQGTQHDGNRTEDAQPGMSLRDWFAGLAMQQIVYRREMVDSPTYSKPELAAESYAYADAMLAARKKERPNG